MSNLIELAKQYGAVTTPNFMAPENSDIVKISFFSLADFQGFVEAIRKDEREKLGKITIGMKVRCIGEFSWEEEADYYDEDGCIVEHVATRNVPWDLCKEVYKAMLAEAIREGEIK